MEGVLLDKMWDPSASRRHVTQSLDQLTFVPLVNYLMMRIRVNFTVMDVEFAGDNWFRNDIPLKNT